MKLLFLAIILISNVAYSASNSEYLYNLGKDHGCSTGYSHSGNWLYKAQKDIDLYVKDEYYKTGFEEGYRYCKGKQDLVNNVIDQSLRGY
jgi:hypothetical protein